MKRTTAFTFMLLMIAFVAFAAVASGQTYRDSIFPVTVPVQHDSSFMTTVAVQHDSTYMDTIAVPVLSPMITLKGMYLHPNDVTIGNQSSEDFFLAYCQRQGVNMLNCYSRAYLYDEVKRTQFAAFTAKAKTLYGIHLVTVDVRFTDSRELPGWIAYFAKYAGTISMIEPLTEFEPYIKNSAGIYDYAGFFNLIRTMGNLSHQYGVKFNYYEGWVGNNYNGLSFSQAPVDSMVKYCDRIFMSNYVTVTTYTADKWPGGMDKRCSTITVGCQRMGIPSRQIVEILSLERIVWGAKNDFLGSYFITHSFYGSSYTDGLAAYNQSTPAVLQHTDVVGRTIFYSTYAKKARP